MNVNPYLSALRRSWVVLIALVFIGGLVGLGLSAVAKPTYTASAKIFFAPAFSLSSTDLNQGATYTQNQMLSFAELATSPIVLKQVISDQGLDISTTALATTITASTPKNTAVLVLATAQATPKLAADIANAVASQLSTTVEALAPATATSRKAITATIVAPATAPSAPSSPNTQRNVLAGLIIGLVLGALVMILRFRLDTRVNSITQLSAITPAPLLGTIEIPRPSDSGPVRVTESYRKLAGTLNSAAAEPSLVLLVASSTRGEGASEVVMGLAAALAERRRKVLVIDANLRYPSIAQLTDLDVSSGLATVLDQNSASSIDEIIQTWTDEGFDILTSGPEVSNPSAALSSPAFAQILADCRKRYDVILIDTAPVAETADASILGEISDGVLLVANSTMVKVGQMTNAVDALDAAGVNLFGIVLNRVRPHKAAKKTAPQAVAPQPASGSTVLESTES